MQFAKAVSSDLFTVNNNILSVTIALLNPEDKIIRSAPVTFKMR